jgi:uncharacterized protein HemX
MCENLIGIITVSVILGAALYFWYKRQKSIMNMIDDEENTVESETTTDVNEAEVVTDESEDDTVDAEPKVKRKARKNYGTKKNRNSKRHND